MNATFCGFIPSLVKTSRKMFSAELKRLMESLCCKWRPLATQQVTLGHLPKRRKILKRYRQQKTVWKMLCSVQPRSHSGQGQKSLLDLSKNSSELIIPSETNKTVWTGVYETKKTLVCGSAQHQPSYQGTNWEEFNIMERFGVSIEVFFEVKTTLCTSLIKDVNARLPWVFVGG